MGIEVDDRVTTGFVEELVHTDIEIAILQAQFDAFRNRNAKLCKRLPSPTMIFVIEPSLRAGALVDTDPSVTATAADREANTIFAAQIEQQVCHRRGRAGVARNRGEGARDRNCAIHRNADYWRADRICRLFMVEQFAFKANLAEIVTENATSFPADLLIDGSRIPHRRNPNRDRIVHDHTGIHTDVGLAVFGQCRHGECRSGNGHS
jgi:hypothetical protein